jgi:transcription elongation factor Elf1
VDPNLGSSEIEVEFDCEQCEGENKVKVQMHQARDFVILCQYCGLRTRLLMQADL